MTLLSDTLEKAGYIYSKTGKIKKIENLYQEVKDVYDCKELEVEEKYDAIFSFAEEKGIYKLQCHGETFKEHYYDPDFSYSEDLKAFMSAFESFIKAIKKKK